MYGLTLSFDYVTILSNYLLIADNVKRGEWPMLEYNNEQDRKQMQSYQKARNFLTINRLFPNLLPIRDLIVIESYLDYQNNFKKIAGCNVGINDQKYGNRSLTIFQELNDLDYHSPITMLKFNYRMKIDKEVLPRIAIRVHLEDGVYINVAAPQMGFKSFDEITKSFEYYFIPWDKLSSCTLNDLKLYQSYHINNIEYKKEREKIKVKQNSNIQIPRQYIEIPTYIWEYIINNLIIVLASLEDDLLSLSLIDFFIIGYVNKKKFIASQIINRRRLKLNII